MHRSGPVKAGWDELERAEYMKALKQPLLLQTPLQVLLETMFSRIQAQATLFADLQKRMERIESRDFNGEEILGRIRMCEESLSSLTHDKLSPFNQQEILERLNVLETKAETATGSQKQQGPAKPSNASDQTHEGNTGSEQATADDTEPSEDDVEKRLKKLEAKLAGVYNLNGKLMAVEQMAEELGTEIPDLEYTPVMLQDGSETATQATSNANAIRSEASQLWPSPTLGFNVSRNAAVETGTVPTGVSNLQPAPSHVTVTTEGYMPVARTSQTSGQPAGLPSTDAALPTHPSHISHVPSSPLMLTTRPGSSRACIAEVMAKVQELRTESEGLKHMLGDLRSTLTDHQRQTSEEEEALSLRLSAVEASTVEMRTNLMAEISTVKKDIRRDQEIPYAEFTAMGAKVETLTTGLAAATTTLTELRDDSMAKLSDQVSDLKNQVKQASETRDMDTLFHTRITKLESAMGDVKTEVQTTVQQLMEDVAKLSDLAPIEEVLQQCASSTDVQTLAAQQAALAASIGGMAEWLAVRPDTADGVKGTGASATRFKCLTCDREIKSQAYGQAAAETKARGVFLPKLEGMPANHMTPPQGPGLNAGELRKLAEERAEGRKGSPPRVTDFEEYTSEQLGKGKVNNSSSPGRIKSGRVVLAPSAGAASIMPKPAPGVQRTPVFF